MILFARRDRMKLVPFNEDYVNCDNTKSNWMDDRRRFDAI